MLDFLLRPWVASCRETGARLSDYIDGELEGRSLARVRRHLARCRHCRALLESLERTLARLRLLADDLPAASPRTVAAVRVRIEHGPSRSP